MENLRISLEKLNNPSKETINARDKFFKECEELNITETEDGVLIEIDDIEVKNESISK